MYPCGIQGFPCPGGIPGIPLGILPSAHLCLSLTGPLILVLPTADYVFCTCTKAFDLHKVWRIDSGDYLEIRQCIMAGWEQRCRETEAERRQQSPRHVMMHSNIGTVEEVIDMIELDLSHHSRSCSTSSPHYPPPHPLLSVCLCLSVCLSLSLSPPPLLSLLLSLPSPAFPVLMGGEGCPSDSLCLIRL